MLSFNIFGNLITEYFDEQGTRFKDTRKIAIDVVITKNAKNALKGVGSNPKITIFLTKI